MSRMTLHNKLALITGAGSGIGRGITIALAKRGCNLILCDINADGLHETETLIHSYGVKVASHQLDVTDKENIIELTEHIGTDYGTLDILINNAGVALSGGFEQVTEADFNWLFSINFHGVVMMTRAFLPLLRKSQDARLVNVSSIYGIIAPAGQVPYSASKFAVRGFTEALRHELQNTTIGVSVVHPGGVATSIAKNARYRDGFTQQQIDEEIKISAKYLVLPPEKAGEIIVTGIEKRQDRILVGNDAKFIAFITRLFPVSYWKIIQRFYSLKFS